MFSYNRRHILHFNITRSPSSQWIVQQLRETFPFEAPHRYLILDRDKKFGLEVIAAIRAMGSKLKRTSFQSPWQNGVADRWVESCRRDLLDHVIVLNERHLNRLLSENVHYCHEDRNHLGLGKETPGGRVRSIHRGRVIAHARLGGLHHHHDRAA
jgi:putative transposase